MTTPSVVAARSWRDHPRTARLVAVLQLDYLRAFKPVPLRLMTDRGKVPTERINSTHTRHQKCSTDIHSFSMLLKSLVLTTLGVLPPVSAVNFQKRDTIDVYSPLPLDVTVLTLHNPKPVKCI